MQKLMATFQPSVDFAKDKYGKAHDVVVVTFCTQLQIRVERLSF